MIEVKNLTRDYKNNKGIFNLNLKIKKGEVYGLLGPNGAGKTTTIRHLLGYLKPKTGIVTINNLDCFKERDKIQKFLGYIPGESSYFEDMRADTFLKFIEKYRKVKADKKIKALTDYLELDTHMKIKGMSKGMKQKLLIISALMHEPEVLILDEPSSGLDPIMQSKFINLLLSEKKKGTTIILSSHSFEEVEKTCGRIGIIKNGKLIANETINNLKEKRNIKYEVTFKNKTQVSQFKKLGFNQIGLINNTLTIAISNDLDKFLKSLNKFDIINLTTPPLNLEEIFFEYFKESND